MKQSLNNQVLSAEAYAKVNLYLHVTGKHQNGYHLLDSLVVFANVNDLIEVAPANDLKVTVKGEYAQHVPADNSVKKAADGLRRHFDIRTGAHITLHKKLPVGAGIGGGSADAAAAIKLLMRLWKISASPKELLAIAMLVGADVPACLQSTSLYMNGIGEVTEAAPKIPGLHLLLISPGKQLLTKDVFGNFKPAVFMPPASHPKQFSSANDVIDYLQDTRNDLQAAAIEMMPEIVDVLKALGGDQNCLLSRMSGSGSACFGLFAKRKYAEDVATKLGQQNPSWWIRVAAIL